MGFIRTPEIRGFAGEDRFNPFPPPNVARDGLNNDYSRGTLKKRNGFVRLHERQARQGGVMVRNLAGTGAIVISHLDAYAFSDPWCVSISVKPLVVPDGGLDVVTCYQSGTDTGFRLYLARHTDERLYFWLDVGDGTTTHTQRAETTDFINLGQPYHVDFGLDASGRGYVAVDGERFTTTTTGIVYSDSGLDWVIGNASTPTSLTSSILVDELRIWNADMEETTLALLRGRELTADEQTADLIGYWRFNDAAYGVTQAQDLSANRNTARFSPSGALTFGASLVPASSSAFGAVTLDGASQYLNAPYVSAWGVCWTGYVFAIEGWVCLDREHVADATICTVGDDGSALCIIRFDGTSNLVEVEFDRDIAGTTVHSTTYTATIGKPFHITASYFYRWLTVTIVDADGETITTADIGAIHQGPSIPGSPTALFGITLGAHLDNVGALSRYAPVTLDDWRFYAIPLDYSTIKAQYDKELSDLSGCVFYSKLGRDNYAVDVTGNSNITRYELSTAQPVWSDALVNTIALPNVRGLIPIKRPNGVDTVLLLTVSDAYAVNNGELTHLGPLGQASEAVRTITYYRDTAVILNGHTEPLKCDGNDTPMPLTPPEPDVSGISADAGAGTGLTGVYRYKFQYIGRDGSMGPVSYDYVETTTLANEDVDITLIPSTTDRQVTTVRIYRTKSNGNVFYRLDDVPAPLPGTTASYNDAIADNDITEEEDPYLGVCPNCVFTFTHQARVFAGNYAGFESRLRYSETDYYERWYPDNAIDFGRGDGDVLTGGLSIGHRALLTKRHSLWLMEGPPYFATKFWSGSGCVSHNTLAVGEQGVYMLSASGVMVWDGQSLPIKVGGDSQNPIWETMNESRWPYAVGAYFPPTQEYWVTFDVQDGSRITMVWSERKQAWGKLDIPVDAYATVSLSGGPMSLLAAVRGYCVELRRGDNDGVNVNDSDYAVTGAVVTGTDASFTVSTPWAGSFLGLDVELLAPDGTTQRRTIWHQNSDEVLVTEPFDAIPDDTYTWELGPIDWYWESGPIHFGENLPDVAVRGADIIFRPTGTEVNCVMEHWGDGDPGTAAVVTVT